MKRISNKTQVSIIIPVFNAAKFLKECLHSVIKQSYKDIEILCVDDGSTDNSAKIVTDIAKKDSRVRLISQQNQGVSAARNNGIKHAKGDFIAFLDADDMFDKDCIKKAYEAIKKNKSDIVVFGTRTVCGQETVVRWDFDIIKKLSNGELDSNNFSITVNLLHNIWDKLYRRDFLIRNDIQFPTGYKIGEDGVFCIECYLNKAKFTYLAECLYNYRIHQGSVSHASEHNIMYQIEAFKYIERLDLYKKQPNDIKAVIFGKYLSGCVWLKQQLSAPLSSDVYRKVQQFVVLQKRKLGKKRIESLYEYGVYKQEFKQLTFKKFIKKLFSIDNDEDLTHKVLTIFCMKFKFKKHYKPVTIDYFKNANQHSVMIFEAQPHHGECIPAYIKYFNDLGFHVDVFVLTEIIQQNPFCRMPDSADFRIIEADWNTRAQILNNKDILKYKHVVISTAICYYEPQSPVIDEFPVFKEHPSLFIVEHDIRDIDKNNERNYLSQKHVMTLWDFNKDVTMVNPCYFGNVKHSTKNVTTFICVGNIESKRKNHAALFKCVDNLLKHTKAFKVIIIGHIIDDFKIPDRLKDYITVTGYLNFPEMFEYMEQADFFIPLLDAANADHDRYITSGVSGSIQLILGFAKVPIIHKKFASFYGFNSDMAMIFNTKDFTNLMLKAINMSANEYAIMQDNLSKYAVTIQNKSLSNIKKAFK